MCYSVLIENNLDKISWDFDAFIDESMFTKLERLQTAQPKEYKIVDTSEPRIFPGYYAPIVFQAENERRIQPMRYSAFPPSYLTDQQAKGLSTFNARCDSLTKRFWSEAIDENHGIISIKSFYEWVSVRQLITAGQVTLTEVEKNFQIAKEQRIKAWIAKGKKREQIQPTKSELKKAIDRETIIFFNTPEFESMNIPIIFSRDQSSGLGGFAIITEEPTKEIRAAGHDRMPIILQSNQINRWLTCPGKGLDYSLKILSHRLHPTFHHKLAEKVY